MDNNISLLDGLTIASPCSVSWDSMKGDERARDCSQCRLRVYNLSAMTRPEAENLLEEKEGKLCVRFFRRADGTVMTQDCPVGLRVVRLRLVRMAGAAVALIAMLAAGLGLRRRQPPEPEQRQMMGEAVAPSIKGRMNPMTATIGIMAPPYATAGKPIMKRPIARKAQ